MARSARVTASYTAHTIMANGTVAYQHEVAGQAYSSDAALPFAETFDLNILGGARLITVKQLIPDIEGAASRVAYSLFYRNGRVVDVDNPNLGGPAEQRRRRSCPSMCPTAMSIFAPPGGTFGCGSILPLPRACRLAMRPANHRNRHRAICQNQPT